MIFVFMEIISILCKIESYMQYKIIASFLCAITEKYLLRCSGHDYGWIFIDCDNRHPERAAPRSGLFLKINFEPSYAIRIYTISPFRNERSREHNLKHLFVTQPWPLELKKRERRKRRIIHCKIVWSDLSKIIPRKRDLRCKCKYAVSSVAALWREGQSLRFA